MIVLQANGPHVRIEAFVMTLLRQTARTDGLGVHSQIKSVCNRKPVHGLQLFRAIQCDNSPGKCL